jgi:hypothetical protein
LDHRNGLNYLVACNANQESLEHATEIAFWGSSMEPPPGLFPTQEVSGFRTVSSVSMLDGHRADLVEMDEVVLLPKVYRFFNAYLDADVVRRRDLRKVVAHASHRFSFDPPVTSSRREDRAAALEIARRAAEISHANDLGEAADEGGSCFVDSCATLALSYRYIVGLYRADSALSKLGELAVKFVLQAEREHDPALLVDGNFGKRSVTTCIRSGQELNSNLSIFVPAQQRDDIFNSLDTISRRLKEQILLLA